MRSRLRADLQRPSRIGAALSGAALLLVLVASPAPAASPVATSSDYFARLDSDRDGRISLAEFQHWMGYAFERMDGDRDGVVEPHELPGGRGRAVRLDEHRAALAALFARQDRDRSGGLDAREFAAPPR
jgi:hypothetical protein